MCVGGLTVAWMNDWPQSCVSAHAIENWLSCFPSRCRRPIDLHEDAFLHAAQWRTAAACRHAPCARSLHIYAHLHACAHGKPGGPRANNSPRRTAPRSYTTKPERMESCGRNESCERVLGDIAENWEEEQMALSRRKKYNGRCLCRVQRKSSKFSFQVGNFAG